MSFDIVALRDRAVAARVFKHVVGRFTFDCLVPSGTALMRNSDRRTTTGEQNYQMVLDHVRGWEGVLQSDVLPGEPKEPLPFSRAAAVLFFEEHLTELGELLIELNRRADERAAQLEADRKN